MERAVGSRRGATVNAAAEVDAGGAEGSV